MNTYHSAEWKIFRAEVIALDGNLCVRCGRGPQDGAILQVHHKEYIKGHKPWEYPHNICETLCKGCHAEEHGKIMPKSDWELVGSGDLGELEGECEYCGTELRHVYMIVHSGWGVLEVGTDCCDNLTGTKEASAYARQVRNRNARRKNFVSSARWVTKQNGVWIRVWIKKERAHLGIVLDGNQFRIQINRRRGKLGPVLN